MEKPKRAYYAVIPADVRYDKDLPSNAKLLYGEITALCNERGYCWATNDYFAGLYEVSPRSITRWISALESKRYIRVELIRKGENIVEKRRITIGDKNVYVDINVHTGRQNCLDDVDKNVQYNNTNINNTLNNKKKEFKPPTIEEVKAYCEERNNNVDAQRFYDYYSTGNWTDQNGKRVINWKQKMIANWEKKEKAPPPVKPKPRFELIE